MGRTNVKDASTRDLIEIYRFIRADADRSFGANERGKATVRARLAEVEAELYIRLYGSNPFVLGTIEGQTPESIDLSKFDKSSSPETYVVHDGISARSIGKK